MNKQKQLARRKALLPFIEPKTKKRKYPATFTYVHGRVHQAFEHYFHGTTKYRLNGASLKFTFYKSQLLMSIVSKHAGDPAWLNGDDIDALVKLLKRLKKVWLRVYHDTVMTANCKSCSKIFAGVCAKHEKVFAKNRLVMK